MNWKHDLQLRDLDPKHPIEVTCRICNHGRNEWPQELLKHSQFSYLYLDELENHLRCAKKGCQGRVRLSLANTNDTEPFVGGLA